LSSTAIFISNGIDTKKNLSRRYQVAGTPKTVFIDRNGRIAYTYLWPISENKLRKEIKKLL
jgi:thioredoxin-related protein